MNNELEAGLYRSGSEDSFETFNEIANKYSPIRKEWNNPFNEMTFEDRIEQAVKLQEWRDKTDRIPEEAIVTVTTTKPIAICNLADTHIGANKVDYEYLKYLVDTIRDNDNAFCFLGGDLCDTLSWNSGQNDNILSFQDQHEMLYSMLEKLKGKILGGVTGNHNWEERNWVSKYQEYLRNADSPLFDNLGWLELRVDNGENIIPYRIVLGHQMRGYSYLNANHPQGRFAREVEGCDIIISNHTHEAGNQNINKKLWGGDAKGMTLINGFTLKKNDKFLRGKGNPNSAVGANWLYLSCQDKRHFAIPNTELTKEVMGWDI